VYKLYYNCCVPVSQITPVLTLDNCLREANTGNSNYQTKLVRLNWIIQDLKSNTIQKPFLINQKFAIITGDTRYMALQFHKNISHVPCLMTGEFKPDASWTTIPSKKELGELLDIFPDNIITNYNWQEMPLDWIEFAYSHTSDHMHDESQRGRMINNYLAKYPDTIFNQDWVLSNINWSLYDH